MHRICFLLIVFLLIRCQNLVENIAPPKSITIRNLNFGQSQKIVFYGTSLTAGGAWVYQVSKILFDNYANHVNVINSGQNGMNSDGGITHVREKVLNYIPDCVFIEFGINDVLWTDENGLKRSTSNLNGIIDSIWSVNSNCEIVLMTMNPRIGDSIFQQKVFDYYNIYREISKERNILLIDNYYDWMNLLINDSALYNYYVPDGVHPTFIGYKNITIDNILEVLGLNTSTNL